MARGLWPCGRRPPPPDGARRGRLGGLGTGLRRPESGGGGVLAGAQPMGNMPRARPPLRRLGALLVGFVYPTFESFKAIESTGSKDDTQVGGRRSARARERGELNAGARPPTRRAAPNPRPPAPQWLMYWVTFATFTTIEKFLWVVLAWWAPPPPCRMQSGLPAGARAGPAALPPPPSILCSLNPPPPPQPPSPARPKKAHTHKHQLG